MSALMTEQLDGIMTVFDQLSARLLSFSDLFLREKPTYFAELPTQTEPVSLMQLQQQLVDVWHKDGEDGRTTAKLYGLIGVSDALLAEGVLLNEAKAAFKQQVSQLMKNETGQVAEQLRHRSDALARALNRAGLGRLHLKQCYRQIPILDRQPDSVKFTWYSSGRSIRKITVQDAIDRLLKLDTSRPHIQIQLDQCNRLRAHTELAQVQTQVPVVRANFVWNRQGDTPDRKARNCPLPILFPIDPSKGFPSHNTLPEQLPERTRAERSDGIIDPDPFLPSIRVHLYRNGA